MAKLSRNWVGFVFIIGAIGLWYVSSADHQGFSDDDIAAAKSSIKREWEKKPGVQVSDITLLRKSSTELVGFVKLVFAGSDYDTTKSCNATMVENHRYIWECK